MPRRPANSGLFTGWWTSLDGKKIRRIRRDEYPELYRLHRKHAAIGLGVKPIGCRAPWTQPPPEPARFGNLHPDTT